MSSRSLLQRARSLLEAFVSSPDAAFRIVSSTGSQAEATNAKTLFVLDSSFNPPHVAHLTLATAALQAHANKNANTTTAAAPQRLLLLFSTHNADKQPGPAPFEHRLAMMMRFADDIAAHVQSNFASSSAAALAVDVGLTKQPFYTAKSAAIDGSDAYSSRPRHVHLVGYDTFIRIFEPKYYSGYSPPLSALEPFFARHGLRITLRPDDKWGGVDEQRQFWQRISQGAFEELGAPREWANEIEVVDSETEALGVSSTAIRQAVEQGDWARLGTLCTPGVSSWIQEHGLYGGSTESQQ